MARPESRSVYILVEDNGYEGYSPPAQAFATREEAEAGLAIASLNDRSWLIYEVPYWPSPADRWLKPVKFGEPLGDEASRS